MTSFDVELRDLDDARRFILQGLWLQRVVFPPSPEHVRLSLEWALEIASSGEALPPVGFVADVGILVFNLDRGERRPRPDSQQLPGLPSILGRTYEDHVLGKLYGDWSFEQASDALRRYEKGRNWSRGLAYLIHQFREHAEFLGVHLPPSIVRGMLDQPAEELLSLGRESLQKDGLMPLLEECYQSMVHAARRTPDILGEEAIEALRSGIALAAEGQRLAHQLVIRASNELLRTSPEFKVPPFTGRQEVPTRVMDEDTYPVGGFAAISTRGTVESLLQSQLAFMEGDTRPDLFDLKYLRDELYYYSRDENQFLRRRRTFVFVLFPELVRARFKDPESSSQRIVLLLGLLRAAILRLSQWLSSDSLRFDFLFLHDGTAMPLTHERHLVELLFGDQIENRRVAVMNVPSLDAVIAHCAERAARSECQVLTLAMRDEPLECEDAVVTRMSFSDANPAVAHGFDAELERQESWPEALERLLQLWI